MTRNDPIEIPRSDFLSTLAHADWFSGDCIDDACVDRGLGIEVGDEIVDVTEVGKLVLFNEICK